MSESNGVEMKSASVEDHVSNQGVNIDLYVDIIYRKIKEMVGDGKVNAKDIAVICLSIMPIVENFEQLRKKGTGLIKKEIVMKALEKFLHVDDPQDQLILAMIPNLLSSFIQIDKREVKINIPQDCCCCL